MNRAKVAVFTWVILLVFPYTIPAQNPTPRQLEKLTAFSKLYGYVKYFHPSNQAAELDWDAFAIYGVRYIIEHEEAQVSKIIDDLYSPIVESLYISSLKDSIFKVDHKTSLSNVPTVQWQHLGNGNFEEGEVYKSKRVFRNVFPSGISEKQIDSFKPLFGKFLEPDELIKLNIDSQNIFIPMVVPFRESTIDYESSYLNLISSLEKIMDEDLSANDLSVRIGNLINVWNSINFFYPYFELLDLNWNSVFQQSLDRCFTDKNAFDYRLTLFQVLSKLNDAHGFISYTKDNFKYYPPIYAQSIDDKFIITAANKKFQNLIGSEILKINGSSPDDLFIEQKKYVPQNLNDAALNDAANNMFRGRFNSKVHISVKLENGKEFSEELKRRETKYSVGRNQYFTKKSNYCEIKEGIRYVDLTKTTMDDFQENFQVLSKSRSIILDLRGYPKSYDVDEVIGYFLEKKDTLEWSFVPEISSPNWRDSSVAYKSYGWELAPKEKSLVHKKVYLLINHETLSYAESIVGYFETLSNVTLVGSTTAGANGNVNEFSLPGGYTYRYTGMKVTKHDGSRLHGIGFLPDVEVKPTITGIIDGRDEVLEKAIELARLR